MRCSFCISCDEKINISLKKEKQEAKMLQDVFCMCTQKRDEPFYISFILWVKMSLNFSFLFLLRYFVQFIEIFVSVLCMFLYRNSVFCYFVWCSCGNRFEATNFHLFKSLEYHVLSKNKLQHSIRQKNKIK